MALMGRQLTTRQLQGLLADVPPASLYRHVRALAEAGVIVCAEQTAVRGTQERVYEVAPDGGLIPEDERQAMTPEDHLSALGNFGTVVTASYRNYVEAGGQEPPRALATPLYLNDAEAKALQDALNALLRPLAENPKDGRRRHLFARILLPDLENPQSENP